MSRWIENLTGATWICLLVGGSLPQQASGSACCGAGVFAPSIISTDDWTQLSLTTTQIDHSTFVDSDGFWGSTAQTHTLRTTRLDIAQKINSKWQMGLTAPFASRTTDGSNWSGTGDLAMSVTHELVREYEFGDLHPRVHLFAQVNAPTGRSRFEASSPGEAFGSGHWSTGIGSLLQKAMGPWDVLTVLIVRQGFAADYTSARSEGRIQPGLGGSVSLGGGYSRAGWRIGGGITWIYESPIEVTRVQSGASSQSSTGLERAAVANFGVSYIGDGDWTATLNVIDQQRFGAPANTLLGQGMLLQFQRRWR